MVLMIESETGHATNVLAADLARENGRLTLLIGHLAARVQQLESRLRAMAPKTITLSGQTIDLASGLIRRNGKVTAKLTGTERAIMSMLAASPGIAVPYACIRDAVWPSEYGETPAEVEAFRHVLRVNLMRIRDKLDSTRIRPIGNGTDSRHFFTASGYGLGLRP